MAMNLNQRHKIRQLDVEVDANWENSPHGIRERVTKLFQYKLVTRLDRMMSELYGPDTLVKIEHLDIDLGDFAEDEFDEEFELRLEDELRKILDTVGQTPNGHQPIKTEVKTERDVLEFYLINGGIPWWRKSTTPISLQQLILQVLKKEPSAFRNLLLGLKGKGQAIHRAAQFHSNTQVDFQAIASQGF